MKKIQVFMRQDKDDGGTLELGIDKDNNLYVNGEKVLTETKLVIDKSVNYAIIAAGVCAVLMLFIEVFKVFHPYI